MTRSAARTTAALVCAVAANLLVLPRWDDLRELAARLVRPIAVPLAWSGWDRACRDGDANEAFARGQQLLRLVPTWTDGHAVFAFRFALDDDDVRMASADERASAALRRLETALAWLEGARADAGRREVDLLQAMALLPEVAAAREPGLEALLRPRGGSSALADRHLAAIEELSPGPANREQRTFFAPRLAAGLLASGDRTRAVAVLDAAIARSEEVRDRALAAEWRERLREIRAALRGETVDLTAVRSDPRMAPLLPHLR